MRIRISWSQGEVTALLKDTPTARRLMDALPCESGAHTWGDEVYFTTPVTAEAEDAQADVPSGTVAYWPVGKALCLFFGQRPYSPVNVVGRLDADPNVLAAVQDGQAVRVEPI